MKCDHCGLEGGEIISESGAAGDLHFCCKGCQGVYHLLHDLKLERFYDLKGFNTLEQPSGAANSTSAFESEAFAKRFITQENGLCAVSLVLEHIHCAACVWLNEKVIARLEGVAQAEINFTTHKAKILFDPARITVGQIVGAIRSIGYDAAPYDPALAETNANRERKEYYTRLVIAVFATMNVMWLAVARYLGLFSGMDNDLAQVIYLAEFCLATPTLFYSGWIFYRGGYYALKNGFVTMDLLVATGASLTYIYSIYAVLIAKSEPYFDSVTMIITFVLIGKFLEVKAKKSAVDTLDSLIAQTPSEVTLIKDGAKTRVQPEAVAVGDTIEVVAGERIVFDGTVKSGEAALDMASLTGESEPVGVCEGSAVLGGAINTDGVLQILVSKDFTHSAFRSIITLLEESLNARPKIENLANSLSRYFSSTILSIAVLTLLGWIFVGSVPFDRALMIAVSVIVIACPCALALATPIAAVIGTSRAAKGHILFKATRHIETMAQAKWLLLDKTGTLTYGKPQVVSHELFADFDGAALLGLIGTSAHPVSQALAQFLRVDGVTARDIGTPKTVPARGVKTDEYLGGNAQFMRENGIAVGEESSTHLFFAKNGALQAVFRFRDLPKADAKTAISKLKKQGLKLAILTGDTEQTALAVASELGIEHIHAGLQPEDKARLVSEYRQRGITVMVGDGLNDAIALARSDIAIAMHSGADTALGVSDVVLLHDSLSDLAESFAIAQKTYSIIKQNIAISIIYNALSVPLAIMGFVVPLVAALSMSFSSLLVVGNSMRINKR
ncbi:copper-translocating P-type ATPase [Campylobacterota bacterium]|nr:copper-translocating P-type ATPase [Campylobacterota bacterium]